MAGSKILGILMSRAAKGKTAPGSTVPMTGSGKNVAPFTGRAPMEANEEATESPAEEAVEGDAGEMDESGKAGTFPYHMKKAKFHAAQMQRKQKRAMPVHAKLALHHAMKAMDMATGGGGSY